MGLIREVSEITASLNRSNKNRQKRENERIELENYKNELESNLQCEFFRIFENTEKPKSAFLYCIKHKDEISNKVYNITSKIKTKPNKDGIRFYKYSNFDIVGDIDKLYYKVLKMVYNRFSNVLRLSNEELEQKLYDYFLYFAEREEKSIKQMFETLSSRKYIILITQDITQEHESILYLQNNYFKILNKIKKLYQYDILQETKKENELKKQIKELKKQIKEREKNSRIKKRNKRILLLFILGGIDRALTTKQRKGR